MYTIDVRTLNGIYEWSPVRYISYEVDKGGVLKTQTLNIAQNSAS